MKGIRKNKQSGNDKTCEQVSRQTSLEPRTEPKTSENLKLQDCLVNFKTPIAKLSFPNPPRRRKPQNLHILGGGWQNPNFDQSETRLESRKCRKQKVNSLHPEAGLPGHRPVTTRPVPGKVSRRNGKRHERHNTRDRPSHVETTEHPEQVAAQPLWFGHL